MTARPVSSISDVEVTLNPESEVTIAQDYESNGPIIVSLDSTNQQGIKVQVRGSQDGNIRDAVSNSRGELTVSPANSIVYECTNKYNTVANVNAYPMGVIPSEGMASFFFSTTIAPSSGFGIQYSSNGNDWFDAIIIQLNQTGQFNSSVRGYTSGAPYGGSLPPCKFVRPVFLHNTTIAANAYRFVLTLSPTVRNDYLMVRISDGQLADNTAINSSNSTTLYPLMVSGPDASKRVRPFSADGSVLQKGQPHSWTYGSIYSPYYANVVATAISRPEASSYKYDQPTALQTNDRGHLQIFSEELKRNQEQQVLNDQQMYMQSLDPNWGFEIR